METRYAPQPSAAFSPTREKALAIKHFTCSLEKSLYKKGQILFREDSPCWGLYFVESGKIKLCKMGSDGKEQILKIVQAGEFVGYTSVLNHARYNVTAVVLEDAVLSFIARQDFLDSLEEDSSMAQHFTHLLCQDVIEAQQRLTAMAYQPVRGRLADALLALDQMYEPEDSDAESFISLSRQDLASLLGTAKETVIRLLSEFRHELLITTDGHRISVLNPQGLRNIAHLYQ